MAVKFVGIILALSLIEPEDVIHALLIKKSTSKCHLYIIIEKQYAGSRAGRCHFCSINRSISRCHLYITIESY